MSESLWSLPADELLRRTASPSPTPGSGSVAAVTGALGLGLVRMALDISDAGHEQTGERAQALLERAADAADRDVAAFGAVIEARGDARGDVERATIAAIEGPLDLAAAMREGLEVADRAEPLVKRELVSDIEAGRDLMRTAAGIALRAAALKIDALERDGSQAVGALRDRLEGLSAALDARR